MSKKRIVVIDDEQDICFLMQELLEATGEYEVDVAYDGASGRELCLGKNPHLVFLDYVMPKEKGDEVLQFFRQNAQLKDIPVVIMSGLGEAVYFDRQDKRKWRPGNPDKEKRGEVSEVFKNGQLPSDKARELGVTAYLAKPFSKDALLKIAESVLGKGTTENNPS